MSAETSNMPSAKTQGVKTTGPAVTGGPSRVLSMIHDAFRRTVADDLPPLRFKAVPTAKTSPK